MDNTMTEEYAPSKNKFLPWIVCFAAALFFFYEFIQMNMFNAISVHLMRDFSINATQLGNLSAIYFYANLLFLPFAGMLLDRFSTRKIILATIMLCTIGIGSFSFTHSIAWASVFRFMSGIGSAFCFLSSIRLASRWFAPQRMALVSGLIVTMAMTGGMVAQTPLTLLIEHFGWRHALLLDSFLGLIITTIIFFLVRDYPAEVSSTQRKNIRNNLQEMGLFRSWRLSYLNIQNWLGGIYTCALNLPSALLGAIWGNLYLVQVEHLTSIQASYVTMMLFVGTIIGGPIAGWISDEMKRRCVPMRVGAILSLAIILLVMYAPTLSIGTYMLLFFLLGFITSTQIISYPLVAENNTRALTATSVSVVSFCTIGGYAVFQPLFGWIMDLHWQGVMVDNVRVYSPAAYHYALMIIPIAFMIALLANFFMRESYCQAKE
jgi:MFS family permease